MKNDRWKVETQTIHAGEPRPTIERAITLPIFQSSTFETHSGTVDYDSNRYIRLNNTPNHVALAEKIATLEGTESGLIAGSGMAAISAALLAMVDEGGELLCQDSLYGGTHHFLKEYFPKMGRSVRFFSFDESSKLEKCLSTKTQAIYVESVSNPLLRIPDLVAVGRLGREKGIPTLIDNTFTSPIVFRPHDLGFDVILHSATKYLNGHSDIVAGAVLGSRAHVKKITKLLNHLGGSLDPHACFLLNRGLKTLAVRVREQNAMALKFAESLADHPKIEKMIFPGLKSHPEFARAKEWFRGFGAVVSFEYKGTGDEAAKFLSKLTIPFNAPSLGGVETLVTRPVTTSHSGVSVEDRKGLGIKDSLVRVSIGLENIDDLIADFKQALG